MFELWQLVYQNGPETGCAQAASAGLSCLFQRGSWSSLRQFDRPAILALIDSSGDSHAAVLTAIDGDMVELSIGGVTVMHPVDSVSDMWFGQYLLLWKPPNGTSASLGTGSRDQNVVWLRHSLASIDAAYRSEPIDSDTFDADLERRVREFQRDNRLHVDGLAGQQTQIIINSLLALDDTPRLSTTRLARE